MGAIYNSLNKLKGMVDNNITLKTGVKFDFVTIFVTIIIIFFIIAVGVMYGKDEMEQKDDDKYRIISAVMMGIAVTLLVIFGMIMVLVTVKMNTKEGKIIYDKSTFLMLIKLLVIVYFYGVYCIFPLIIYGYNGEDIYNIKAWDSKKYENSVSVIRVITNLIVVLGLIYSVWLILWYKEDIIKKRQLMIPVIITGIAATASIKSIIYTFQKTPNQYCSGIK